MRSIQSLHNRSNEQGVALVTTLLFLTVMALLSTALVFTVQNEMKSSTAYKYNQQAFYVADAGVQEAVHWYRNSYTPLTAATGDGNYDTTECPVQYNNDPVMLAGCTESTSVYPDDSVISSFLGEFSNITLQADPKNTGVYAVNATLLKHIPKKFLNLTDFTEYDSAIERWALDSTGYWGNANNPLGIVRIEAVIENNGNALFDRGLWGIEGVKAAGSIIVDSFDPALGVWDPFTNHGKRGSVGSNRTITVSGDANISGDVVYGPTGDFVVNGGATVTGQEYKLTAERDFPSVPSFRVGSGNEAITGAPIDGGVYGSFRVGPKNPLILNAGTYWIDSIEMTSALSEIQVLGPVTLYVKSGFKLTGQGIIIPPGTDPAEITVYYEGTDEATLVGGSRGYMEFYGPDADVKLAGSTDFNGSFIGKTLNIVGDGVVHFNEDGRAKKLIQRPFRILSWSQKSTLEP